MATVFSVEELAYLARKDYIPEFVYAKFERSKKLLLGYPRSLNNWEEELIFPLGLILVLLGVMLGSVIIVFLVFLMIHIDFDEWLEIIPELRAAFIIFLIGMFIRWRLSSRARRRRDEVLSLVKLGKNLGLLSDITGYPLGHLVNLQAGDLKHLAEDIMVEACKKVLLWQKENTENDPTEWRGKQKDLMDDVGTKYDNLLKFGLVDPGGYARFYRIALQELAS